LQTPSKQIGIDLDGVVADIVTQLVWFSRKKFAIRLDRSEFRSENIETCTPIKSDQLESLFRDPKFFRSMRAVPGARALLGHLRSAGCKVHVITDRFWYPEIHDDTRQWIVDRMIQVDSVRFATKGEKQLIARQLQLEWFIEDQRSNANALSSACPVLLIDRPYNQGVLAPNVVRVRSFRDAVGSVLLQMRTEPQSLSHHHERAPAS
jgi:uncharacterized HAD superfamily protein